MFACKSSFVTSFLVIISIGHYVFAALSVENCRMLLRNEYNFQDEDLVFDGLRNYINAFKYLSKNKIKMKYGKPQNREESGPEKIKRKLTGDLVESYFKDLFEHNGIDVGYKKIPLTWCKAKVFGPGGIMYDIRDSIMINKLAEDSPYTYCLTAIINLLKNDDDLDNPWFIFRRLYEDWTIESVGEMECKANSYAIQFFGHYQDVFDELDLKPEDFLSIKQFCKKKGYAIVKFHKFQ